MFFYSFTVLTCHVSCNKGVPPRWKRPATCTWGQPTCTKWPRIGVVRKVIISFVDAFPLYRSVSSLTWNIILSAAGNAFSQAARLHLQMQSKHDAATNFIDAGNAFKKADPQGNNYWPPTLEYTLTGAQLQHSFYKLLFLSHWSCLLWCRLILWRVFNNTVYRNVGRWLLYTKPGVHLF